ncbi:retrovirus-related pol polyprotein from transposon TNT 1-94 [Tanacetum coccineum]
MTTMAENVIVAEADNCPPMLEKSMYNSWQSRMLLYIRGKEHGKDLVDSVLHEPFQYGTVVENDITRSRTYEKLTNKEKICEECLAVPSFLPGDDLIASLNKAMAFISTSIASCNGSKSKATSSGGNRNVGNNSANQTRVIRCYNCQGKVHMARQCTQPKKPRNFEWFKEKMLLVQAHKSGVVLDERQLEFLADPGDALGPVRPGRPQGFVNVCIITNIKTNLNDFFKMRYVTPSNLSTQRNVEYPRELLYGSITQDMRTTTKRVV